MDYEGNERSAPSRRAELKRKGFFTCVWLLFVIVIFMIFLIKREEIKKNLEATEFFERLFGKTPSFLEKPADETARKKSAEEPVVSFTEGGTPAVEIKSTAKKSERPKTAQNAENEGAAEPVDVSSFVRPKAEEPGGGAAAEREGSSLPPPQSQEAAPAVSAAEDAEPSPKARAQGAQMSAKLYFVKIDVNGNVSRTETMRSILKNDSPLSTNLSLLLKGPDESEKMFGVDTLIPEGTRLLGATVRDGVAYLDFSGELEFNPAGVEGLLAELMQIVYTATEFSTVDSVQFSIDGEKKNYLGLEGVWIGSPLSRTSFK